MDKHTFNHDKFNTWKNCPRRYFYKYIRELNWPELSDDYKLGVSIHRLMDYYLRGFDVDNLVNNADQDVQEVWNNIKDYELLKNKVIATEWGFNCRIGKTNYWLNGRIDAIFHDKESGKYIIADWKTGIIPKNPEETFQHIIYLYAFYKCHKDLKLDIKPENLMFQYIKVSNQIDTFSIDFLQNKITQYEDILANKINEIESATNFIKSENCEKILRDCQYKYLCMKDND
ncbi:MAG: PD-(D/E)XK nuclease family protein [Candidatus Gastranaerophilales bacterium]|nr:PD-(D/E)XK nuclease family protein [Candidatus Gastranaerophilales bacterium]